MDLALALLAFGRHGIQQYKIWL